MPQVVKTEIKARAARLREAGAVSAAEYLRSQTGTRHRVLMERPRMGRTETFAEVRFETDQPVGGIVEVTVSGADGQGLFAAEI